MPLGLDRASGWRRPYPSLATGGLTNYLRGRTTAGAQRPSYRAAHINSLRTARDADRTGAEGVGGFEVASIPSMISPPKRSSPTCRNIVVTRPPGMQKDARRTGAGAQRVCRNTALAAAATPRPRKSGGCNNIQVWRRVRSDAKSSGSKPIRYRSLTAPKHRPSTGHGALLATQTATRSARIARRLDRFSERHAGR